MSEDKKSLRVPLNCRIDPETRAKMDALQARLRLSQGRVVDDSIRVYSKVVEEVRKEDKDER